MTIADDVFRLNLPQVLDDTPSCSQDFHVLAVDDSHVDHKVIKRLLKISSCKVTVVDSGTRALQYLRMDGVENSIGFNVSISDFGRQIYIYNVISNWN
ncbi:hypothetical protein K1719_011337 [Acacia pycnantha]|nr:hypothetical protein K1719_011337 [Acacia pycnantha]